MPTRRDLLRSAALVPVAALPLPLASIDAALAQAVDLLKLFVPAAPGGGWDQTARTMEQVLRKENLISGAQITNVAGARSTVATSRCSSRPDATGPVGLMRSRS